MTFRGRIHKKYWLCNAPPSKFDNLAVAMLSRPHQMCPKGPNTMVIPIIFILFTLRKWEKVAAVKW